METGTINVNSDESPDAGLEPIIRNLKMAAMQSHVSSNPVNRPLLGISLGSMRDIRDERAATDYLKGISMFSPYADYLVVNLSRPGSVARGADAECKALCQLLHTIMQRHAALMSGAIGRRVPVIVKLAIEQHQQCSIRDVMACAREPGFDGILAAFEHWTSVRDVNECIKELKAFIQPLPLIVVGGIRTVNDIHRALAAGRRFKYRTVIFFFLLLFLAITSFSIIRYLLPV